MSVGAATKRGPTSNGGTASLLKESPRKGVFHLAKYGEEVPHG